MKDICYLCEKELPTGQSYYEDHGVKVCLNCFRTTKRCIRCRFPSRRLKYIPGYGDVCEFCEGEMTQDDGMTCYICQNQIFDGASHYSGHGKKVCQQCFANATERCFSCKFPLTEGRITGFGGICKFCLNDNISKTTDLNPIIQSLIPFLKSHHHKIVAPLDIHWLDWRVILGMQMEEMVQPNIHFLDDLIRHCYPILYLKERIYTIPSMPQVLFLPFIAGQLAAADLCQKYKLPHLLGNDPFQQLARGWCHWISYSVARVLRYKRTVKILERFPGSQLTGTFPKFLAMSEFRKNKEIIGFAQQNLKQFAKKYL